MANPRCCSLHEALTSSPSRGGAGLQSNASGGVDGRCAGGVRGLRDAQVYSVIYAHPQSKVMREYYSKVRF